MEFWIKPETYYAYIGVMFCLALGFAYRIYWGRYCNAKKTSKSIELKLEELRKVDSTEERVKLLSQWLAGEEKQPYIKECVYPAWQRYETQYNESTKQGNPVLPDVYDYFHEDLFVHHFGKRKLAEFVPNTILAMGIIGTFVGIAAGVGGLDPSGDSTAMKHGIGLLLSGMEVKFISSIAGIAISVLWQLFDKGILHKLLTTSFRTVRESIDATYPLNRKASFLKTC
ncbi:hypothetical protein [Paenibacillus pasadenensis]|uniref:hypothetical protein n=1 Tax=Paenibacillus pasadenensis TaxID=217090 RepID=UPI000C7E0F90|nr:hypothetical protein [Paenibacillus pasadenensis]